MWALFPTEKNILSSTLPILLQLGLPLNLLHGYAHHLNSILNHTDKLVRVNAVNIGLLLLRLLLLLFLTLSILRRIQITGRRGVGTNFRRFACGHATVLLVGEATRAHTRHAEALLLVGGCQPRLQVQLAFAVTFHSKLWILLS